MRSRDAIELILAHQPERIASPGRDRIVHVAGVCFVIVKLPTGAPFHVIL